MATRRDFLKSLTLLSSGLAIANSPTSIFASELDEASISEINLEQDGYKALVSVFLVGGNDSVNMLIPYEEKAYNEYKKIRPSVAYEKEDLLPINNKQHALNPKMKGIKKLYNAKKLAFLANVGTLIKPIKKEEINIYPPHLFSHNSQRQQWQSCRPNDIIQKGWAGILADAMQLPSFAKIPYNISLNGNNTWQKGNETIPFRVAANGTMKFKNIEEGTSHKEIFENLLNESCENPLIQAYAKIQKKTLDRSEMFDSILQDTQLETNFKNTTLSQKLELVAKIIKARDIFGLPRQMFYVTHSGYDTHNAQKDRQEKLLGELDDAIVSFDKALKEMQIQNSVTTFIGSDFGRTVTSNTDGTDHGWGGHYFVMGGAVDGGKIFGEMPNLGEDSEDIVKKGRLQPKISVEQYASTLCKWYGLSDESLNELFPNLKNFDTNDLGFMKS